MDRADGLIYQNRRTYELTSHQDDVLDWMKAGDEVSVYGYFLNTTDGIGLKEKWFKCDGTPCVSNVGSFYSIWKHSR